MLTVSGVMSEAAVVVNVMMPALVLACSFALAWKLVFKVVSLFRSSSRTDSDSANRSR